MEFITGIESFNYNPISSYNNALKGNASFDVKTEMPNNFDKILSDKIGPNTNKSTDPDSADTLMSNIQSAFGNGLNSVNSSKIEANRLQEALARGEDVSVHDIMIASEKASLSMQMAMQLRNKLVSAYTDIKNMNF